MAISNDLKGAFTNYVELKLWVASPKIIVKMCKVENINVGGQYSKKCQALANVVCECPLREKISGVHKLRLQEEGDR